MSEGHNQLPQAVSDFHMSNKQKCNKIKKRQRQYKGFSHNHHPKIPYLSLLAFPIVLLMSTFRVDPRLYVPHGFAFLRQGLTVLL